ncbi:hypothetical protein HK103_007690 [Boothiomyces macroporosus]|uniref:SET domain-containing protein n=1 Tax=Boothiomyces macroporosus TaxID=261099 RepID=A0AAD5UBN2_9FUNG|nr:hypothetical protein HK103_007690 [Boothiomyces macroporosus]
MASKQKENKWKLFTQVNFIVLALSGLLFSYLGSRVVNLNKKTLALQEQIERCKEIISKYQEIVNLRELSEEEKPHLKYLKYIPTDPTNPFVPLDPDVRYTYDDFERIFQVIPLHEVSVESELDVLLENHNLLTDLYYLNNKEHIDRITEETATFFAIPNFEAYMRDFCHVKWASEESGFGLFANQDILENQVIGIYTGEIDAFTSDTEYEWPYKTKVLDGKEVTIGINGIKFGNYLRFVNHDINPNAKAEYVPYDGLWHVVYIANQDIAKDEEITINYDSRK